MKPECYIQRLARLMKRTVALCHSSEAASTVAITPAALHVHWERRIGFLGAYVVFQVEHERALDEYRRGWNL